MTPTPPAIPNFRDAGGLATGSLRPGLVFRSAHLAEATPAAHASLIDHAVSAVYDLRTAEEVRHRPDDLPAGIGLTVLDVLADRPHSGAAAVASLVTERPDRATVADIDDAVADGRARDLMIETYRYLVSLPSAHAGYRALLLALGQEHGATVIHCTAGKDRTGWAIAVLQRLGGASADDVLADYLRSNEQMELAYGPMLAAFAAEGGDAESLSHMIYVRPEYLDAATTLAARVHGSLDGYLRTALGLTSEELRRVRARLLT